MEIGFYEWRRACWDVSRGVRRGICLVRPNITEDGQIRQISDLEAKRESLKPSQTNMISSEN